jgi:endonuclease/exonuclease/phosphatase family metal-dependent hydrolase
MIIAIAVAFSLLVLLLVIVATRTPAENYTDEAGPLYTGYYDAKPEPFNGRMKVVSWNLNFATRVDQAIYEFQTVDELHDADIILLQEMDEHSIEKVAQSLGYNYIYYPAAIHRRHNRQFGNAILSKWLLSEPQKIILSDNFRGLKHNRIAVRALVNLGDQQIVAYSAHLDMVWVLPGQGETQVDTLTRQVAMEIVPAIVGGDFNSWNSGSIEMLEERFGEIGLMRVTKGTGPTIETYGGVKLTLDHIFASEIFESQSGLWQQPKVSDHSAVWTILSIEETNQYE